MKCWNPHPNPLLFISEFGGTEGKAFTEILLFQK